MAKLASSKTCTGCLACVDSCNINAINKIIRNDGHFYVKIDKSICIQCGLCEKACPIVSNFDYSNSKYISSPFAAWNKNDKQRFLSSSGGVFTALAETILKRNGFVIGVTMSNSQAFHIIIDNCKNLKSLQGSKYQQSDTTSIYKKTHELLKKDNLVLFQGTPCQIAGLLSFIGVNQYQNLITIDIICGGVPSFLLVKKFLKYYENCEIKSYRDKIDGWGKYNLIIKKNDNEFRNPKKSKLIINGFAGSLTNRYSCYDCKFNGLYRQSDITLADYWGDKEFIEQHQLGLSFVTTHSEKGSNLLKESNVEIYNTTWAKAIPANPRMVYGKVFLAKWRFERLFLGFFFAYFPYSFLNIIYGNNFNSILLFPFKLYRYTIWKIGKFILTRKIRKIIHEQE